MAGYPQNFKMLVELDVAMKLTPALLPHLIEAIADVIEKNAE